MEQDKLEFVYTPLRELEMAMHVDLFQWSVFMPCNAGDSVLLLDYNGNRLNVKINSFIDDDGIITTIFYPIAVLYNDTDYSLHLKDPDNRTTNSFLVVAPGRGISLSNHRVLVFKPDLPPTSGFTSKASNYAKVYMSQDDIICGFEVNAIGKADAGETKSHCSPTAAIETLVINHASLKTIGSHGNAAAVNQRISTKFVTVSHKYYFNNDTEHTVLVRKYGALKLTQPSVDVR
jgi:hypothetical protein